MILLTENKREKIFGNLLTKPKIYDILYTKDKAKENAKKPERTNAMKKATLETIRTALLDAGYESTDPIMEELTAEINRGAEEKAARAASYEAIHDIVMEVLSDTPATIAEIYAAVEDKMPAGMTKSKVQYAITRLWTNEIVKVDGKPNGYRKA